MAQGEHARRVAAELLVMRGDTRKLGEQGDAPKFHRKGLRDRLRGGLAGLPILLRLADQELDRKSLDGAGITSKLRLALQRGAHVRLEPLRRACCSDRQQRWSHQHMTNETQKSLLVLATGLFPDSVTIEAALLNVGDGLRVQLRSVEVETMNDSAWDELLADILRSPTIVTL